MYIAEIRRQKPGKSLAISGKLLAIFGMHLYSINLKIVAHEMMKVFNNIYI